MFGYAYTKPSERKEKKKVTARIGTTGRKRNQEPQRTLLSEESSTQTHQTLISSLEQFPPRSPPRFPPSSPPRFKNECSGKKTAK
mmetsp:Transcript_28690/g.50501  ORF Transcript_28690/g.50501 Transcript_28690/m.50501 type:complete len:85 (+) Transcript_28690:2000-2254(+)